MDDKELAEVGSGSNPDAVCQDRTVQPNVIATPLPEHYSTGIMSEASFHGSNGGALNCGSSVPNFDSYSALEDKLTVDASFGYHHSGDINAAASLWQDRAMQRNDTTAALPHHGCPSQSDSSTEQPGHSSAFFPCNASAAVLSQGVNITDGNTVAAEPIEYENAAQTGTASIGDDNVAQWSTPSAMSSVGASGTLNSANTAESAEKGAADAEACVSSVVPLGEGIAVQDETALPGCADTAQRGPVIPGCDGVQQNSNAAHSDTTLTGCGSEVKLTDSGGDTDRGTMPGRTADRTASHTSSSDFHVLNSTNDVPSLSHEEDATPQTDSTELGQEEVHFNGLDNTCTLESKLVPKKGVILPCVSLDAIPTGLEVNPKIDTDTSPCSLHMLPDEFATEPLSVALVANKEQAGIPSCIRDAQLEAPCGELMQIDALLSDVMVTLESPFPSPPPELCSHQEYICISGPSIFTDEASSGVNHEDMPLAVAAGCHAAFPLLPPCVIPVIPTEDTHDTISDNAQPIVGATEPVVSVAAFAQGTEQHLEIANTEQLTSVVSAEALSPISRTPLPATSCVVSALPRHTPAAEIQQNTLEGKDESTAAVDNRAEEYVLHDKPAYPLRDEAAFNIRENGTTNETRSETGYLSPASVTNDALTETLTARAGALAQDSSLLSFSAKQDLLGQECNSTVEAEPGHTLQPSDKELSMALREFSASLAQMSTSAEAVEKTDVGVLQVDKVLPVCVSSTYQVEVPDGKLTCRSEESEVIKEPLLPTKPLDSGKASILLSQADSSRALQYRDDLAPATIDSSSTVMPVDDNSSVVTSSTSVDVIHWAAAAERAAQAAVQRNGASGTNQSLVTGLKQSHVHPTHSNFLEKTGKMPQTKPGNKPQMTEGMLQTKVDADLPTLDQNSSKAFGTGGQTESQQLPRAEIRLGAMPFMPAFTGARSSFRKVTFEPARRFTPSPVMVEAAAPQECKILNDQVDCTMKNAAKDPVPAAETRAGSRPAPPLNSALSNYPELHHDSNNGVLDAATTKPSPMPCHAPSDDRQAIIQSLKVRKKVISSWQCPAESVQGSTSFEGKSYGRRPSVSQLLQLSSPTGDGGKTLPPDLGVTVASKEVSPANSAQKADACWQSPSSREPPIAPLKSAGELPAASEANNSVGRFQRPVIAVIHGSLRRTN